jgi:hypothetical protein
MQIEQLKNKRRGTKSQEKIIRMADKDFCMVTPQSKKKREGKKK